MGFCPLDRWIELVFPNNGSMNTLYAHERTFPSHRKREIHIVVLLAGGGTRSSFKEVHFDEIAIRERVRGAQNWKWLLISSLLTFHRSFSWSITVHRDASFPLLGHRCGIGYHPGLFDDEFEHPAAHPSDHAAFHHDLGTPALVGRPEADPRERKSMCSEQYHFLEGWVSNEGVSLRGWNFMGSKNI